jgi:hypothetical protein
MLDIESGERNISFCNRFPESSYVFVLDKEAICEFSDSKRAHFLNFILSGFQLLFVGQFACNVSKFASL